MSKKFRVGQMVKVDDEFEGEVVGCSVSSKHGLVFDVNVDGEIHSVKDEDLKPVAGKVIEEDKPAKEEKPKADESGKGK